MNLKIIKRMVIHSMSRKEIEKIITENIREGYFTGGTTDNIIIQIEKSLKVTLPESYKWFLMKYGSGGIFGVDILGVGKSNSLIVVTETMLYRKYGLEQSLVVIENCDEFIYCLDTGELKEGECPVVSWDQHVGYDSIEAKDFNDFLLERLSDAEESWEE